MHLLRGVLLTVLWLYAQEKKPVEEDIWGDLFEEETTAGDTTSNKTTEPVHEVSLVEDTLAVPLKRLPPLRLIDTSVHPRLPTATGFVQVSTNHPFLVQLVRPKLVNTRGYPLPHGFDTWYLYIVRTEQFRVGTKVINTQGCPAFLAIVSPAKELSELPTVLESPSLMLKGIVDFGDTIVKHFKEEKKRLKSVLDSLMRQRVSEDEIHAEAQLTLLERVADSLEYAASHYELYRHFRRAKASEKLLVEFFLSFPFNRTLTYSIYAAPYALPRYIPSEKAFKSPKGKRS